MGGSVAVDLGIVELARTRLLGPAFH